MPFTQYVADNLDHNIKTLDGLGTFHGMGIIAATVNRTGSLLVRQCTISRCGAMRAAEAVKDRCVQIVHFDKQAGQGLDMFNLESLKKLKNQPVLPPTCNLTNLWHINGFSNTHGNPHPNWAGYMQTVVGGVHPGVSTIDMLAIVDLNPSDDSCIYSTLLYIIEHAKSMKLPTACVTFDQPLYIKALDISMKAGLPIVIRLGGFHTLMSYLGSIANVMRGSGLEDMLSLMYGSNTIEHILTGKAYARAIRGHFLVQQALVQLLVKYLVSSSLSFVDFF